ncbi:phosphoesterase PA-phosphatase [Betaproteobacteria bacterium SCGC AG-212-J23]|nr:phosphoesterase PA-phosphatase [Betaproteobacteria bacterium SCGC AG-212-J23]
MDIVARVLHWDERLCVKMNRALRYTAVTPFFRAMSWLGNGIFWYALILAFLVRDGAGGVPAVLHMILVGVACTTIYKILKRGTLRPRPYEVVQAVAPGAAVLDNFSFPSGHTLHAVAFSLVASAYYPALAIPLAVVTLLTAASRVVLGLHYPSDVLAGAAIGATLAGLSFGI